MQTQDSESPAALLRLDDVDVALDGHTLLHDINWRLGRGVHWGVVGANGSGKSTLLKLIGGLLWPAPDRGRRVYDFGAGPQTDAVGARRHVASVGDELQDRYARWGWNFTAVDVVLSGIFRTDVPRKRALPAEHIRARVLLRELGLAALEQRPFLELSRGEQRRVLIARALAFEPLILLLDEPAAGLDDAARAALHDTITQISTRVTLVCSGHRVADLPQPLDHVLALDRGRIVYSGPRSAATGRDSRPEPGAGDTAADHRAEAQDAPATNRTPLIDVDRASLWRGGRRVLNGLSWQLSTGEHWLIRGTNGSGKSSFLRLLHGQLRPARGGHIAWPGLGNPRNVWKLRRSIAWLAPELQAAYRYPSTVQQCIASGFDSSIGLTRALNAAEQARVAVLLERFDLTALAARALDTLSYGQLKRVLIARALANRPIVLLLDEPWEGLDPDTAEQLQAQLRRVIAEGTQLVCASHLSRFARRFTGLFTHELLLRDGRIASAGPAVLSRDDAAGERREN